VFFLRGMVPLLERWIGSSVAREYKGRVAKRYASNVIKQRGESQYDIEMRGAVASEIADIMPEGVNTNKVHALMAHLSEAWRCWKANIPWKIPGMPPPLESLILRHVKAKADWWVSNTHYAREGTVDKAIVRKNTGRLVRLYLKEQSDIQSSFIKDGPFFTSE